MFDLYLQWRFYVEARGHSSPNLAQAPKFLIGSMVISLSRCCFPNDEGPAPQIYLSLSVKLRFKQKIKSPTVRCYYRCWLLWWLHNVCDKLWLWCSTHWSGWYHRQVSGYQKHDFKGLQCLESLFSYCMCDSRWILLALNCFEKPSF